MSTTLPPVDLEGCAREPIRIPGRVQPHGALLVLSEPGLSILQVSANCGALLGRTAADLLGKPIETLSGPDQLQHLRNQPSDKSLKARNPLKLNLTAFGHQLQFDGIVHRNQQGLLLELEPARSRAEQRFASLSHAVQGALASLEGAVSLKQLCELAALEIRELTGFDRVMIYQFDPLWNGRVVAESKVPEADSFDGLHFPASDIPRQARELYLLNWLRLIPDSSYQPVELKRAPEASEAPLDLSFSVLRSVSPVHLEYLRNMGVAASMSISIIKDHKLWGLIACHHSQILHLPFDLRLGCELIGKFMSLQLASREAVEDLDYKRKLESLRPVLFQRMLARQAGDFLSALVDRKPDLLEVAGAAGAAIVYQGEIKLLGATPGQRAIEALTLWLSGQGAQDLFATDSLAACYPPGEELKDTASGLLALRIPEPGSHYVLWFRPEVIHTVNWAGSLDKPVTVVDGSPALSPRKSFELWKQTVRLHALPWMEVELLAATELRRSLIEVDLGRQVARERAARDEAERSNRELDEFAYVVSHDLKEPMRGIEHYAGFIAADEADRLSPETRGHLHEIAALSRHGQQLLTSLHEHSKIGRVKLSLEATDLDELVRATLHRLQAQIGARNARVEILRRLPVVSCDPVTVGEVFANLISNALKYSDRKAPLIEVGYRDEAPLVFEVRDDGIGIAPEHQSAVFDISRRLHGADQYGGGSGSGLAIVKRIVERHGGRIWVESRAGHGSTFRFTLSSGEVKP
jgi:chemotaxis family two-component system sensor kinase Cph1